MTSYAAMRRLERWALAATAGPVTRWRARLAVAWLARLIQRRSVLTAYPLVRVAAGPPGPVAGRALRALVEIGVDLEIFGEIAHQCLLQSGGTSDSSTRAWSAVAAPLLLAPAPPGRHVPHGRLVSYLDHEPTASTGRDKRKDVVDQLMMCVSFDSPRRPDLQEFLSTTDHPLILDALAAQWRTQFLPNELIEEVTVANPYIVPRDSGDVLLAVAKDRFDLVDDDRADTAEALVRGTDLTGAGLADKYRRALRELGPGAAREQVCKVAQQRLRGQDEARTAAIDAGYLPADERDHVVFLYLTEQWERYDAADPDGQKIYHAWVASSESHDWRDNLSYEISEVARRTGRADPRERWLAAHPPRRTDPDEQPSRGGGRIGGVSGAWGDIGGSVHT